MNELWKRRTYPIIFELCTASKNDRIDLYGSFPNTTWAKPIAQLTYAYQKNPGEYIYSETVHLVPGNYEYRYKINNKDWILHQTKTKTKDNNVLSKDDFIQLIIDQYEVQEMKNQDDQTCYHDAALILYKNHIMYDVELVVNGNNQYKAHRAILAAGSDYFKAMFQSGMTESTSNSISLKLNDAQGFPAMLRFLYTGKIATTNLSFDQLTSLMTLADIYQISTLFKTLLNFTTRTIDANNCLRLLFMQELLSDRWATICKECIKISANNFLYICHQAEFLELPVDILSDILDHADILVPNQAMLNSALYRWSQNLPAKNQQNDSDNEISKYMVSDLYIDSIKKCNDIYKKPSTIVCFFADGTERYTTMTINAINSFLNLTPHVIVGLLVMNNDTKILVLNKIDRKYHYRIVCKQTSEVPVIKDWNPTQYKLDIIKFSYHGFQEIYWMDSDTVTYKDMTSRLYAFRSSTQVLYLTLDHVMYDPNFMKNWREQHKETIIPQACFMGFKSSIITSLFSLWKQAWIKWIQPQPFSVYKDPNPSFPGSAFCIEQYALGNAVYNFIVGKSSIVNTDTISKYVNVFGRDFIFVPTKQVKEELDKNKILRLCSIIGQQPCTTSVPCVVPYMHSVSRTPSSLCMICHNHRIINVSQPNNYTFIDHFLDCLLHFYNQNYEEVYQWYLQNLL